MKKTRYIPPLICLLLTFALACFARLLELPFWDNEAYRLGEEYLLATHDAYHWIAGAEGFEFGSGHPMAELARFLSGITGKSPAIVGFWLPPFMSGLLAVAVFLWAWGLGHPYAGLCAGVLSSLAPAFFARTLLGFYDSDLVVLLFAVLLGLIPALWLSPWLASLPEALFPVQVCKSDPESVPEAPDENIPWYRSAPFAPWYFGKEAPYPGCFFFRRGEMEESMLTWPWLGLLVLSGLFGHGMQGWHSLFPYLVRFSALVPLVIIPILGPRGGRKTLLAGSLCHAFPLLLGWPGALIGGVYAAALVLTRHRSNEPDDPPVTEEKQNGISRKINSMCWRLYPPSFDFQRGITRSGLTLIALWAAVLFLALDTGVFQLMKQSFFSYVSRSGDIASASAALEDPLVFPSVAQSIIEVQTISLRELLAYIYPLEPLTLLCLVIFACRLLVTPAFIWFLPLLALALLSLRMGARMTLFGPPVLMLVFCMEGGLALEALLQALRRRLKSAAQERGRAGPRFRPGFSPVLRLGTSLFCTALLSWPLITYLPDYTQGPIISREQAEALSYLKNNSPKESLVWNWWDWGYATHHFAQRETIADGARHGGPSLYLPAAVYTTADPRFARQVIKFTATRGNIPGNVFTGRSARQAQQLMVDLGNPSKPLIQAPGKQYIVVSLELLRLGLWVTRYGSWNFDRKAGSGSLMNNLSARLSFNMDTGVILRGDGQPVYAASINIIEKEGLESVSYNRYGAYHFIFSTQPIQYAERGGLGNSMHSLWNFLRPDYVFPSLLSDKLVMDDVFYNTMMVQLLLCPKDDPFISPYFKLVFDNRYSRVYEVL